MEIKSRVTRLAGLLCVASALQGFPVISSTNPGGIISVTQQGTYHLTGTIVDGYGEPVIGANILEKGTTNGTISTSTSSAIHPQAARHPSRLKMQTLPTPPPSSKTVLPKI